MAHPDKSSVESYLQALENLLTTRMSDDRKALHRVHNLQRLAQKFDGDGPFELPASISAALRDR